MEKQADKKLDWMYKSANSLVDREEYLLGRSVDKTLEQINAEEKEKKFVLPTPKNHVEHECIPPSIRDFNKIVQSEQVDLAAKLQEDPLMAIKKREEEARRQFLQNPIQLKKLQEALMSQEAKKKKSKKPKLGDSDSDIDRKIAEKLRLLKSNSTDSGIIKKEKKKSDSALDTILMHKFNALKDQLSEKDFDDIMNGKTSSSSSSSLDSECADSSSDEKQKKYTRKRTKRRNSISSEEEESKGNSKRRRGKKYNSSDEERNSKQRKVKVEHNRHEKGRDRKYDSDHYDKNNKEKQRKQKNSKKSRVGDSSEESDSDIDRKIMNKLKTLGAKSNKKVKEKRKSKKIKENGYDSETNSDTDSEVDKKRKEIKKKRSSKKHTESKKQKHSSSTETDSDDSNYKKKLKKGKKKKKKKKDHESNYISDSEMEKKRKSKGKAHDSDDTEMEESTGYERKSKKDKKSTSEVPVRTDNVNREYNKSKRDENTSCTSREYARTHERDSSSKLDRNNSKNAAYKKYRRSEHSPDLFRGSKNSSTEHKKQRDRPTDKTDTYNSDDLNKQIEEKLKLLRGQFEDGGKSTQNKSEMPAHVSQKSNSYNTDTESSNSEEDSDSAKKMKPKNFGLVTPSGKKIELKGLSESANRENPKLLPKTKNNLSINPERKSNKKLSEEEKEKIRREMMTNAIEREREREDNLKRYREDHRREEERMNKQFDRDFVHQQLCKSTSTATVEDRIKSNVNKIQRSSRHMDTNFSRR